MVGLRQAGGRWRGERRPGYACRPGLQGLECRCLVCIQIAANPPRYRGWPLFWSRSLPSQGPGRGCGGCQKGGYDIRTGHSVQKLRCKVRPNILPLPHQLRPRGITDDQPAVWASHLIAIPFHLLRTSWTAQRSAARQGGGARCLEDVSAPEVANNASDHVEHRAKLAMKDGENLLKNPVPAAEEQDGG